MSNHRSRLLTNCWPYIIEIDDSNGKFPVECAIRTPMVSNKVTWLLSSQKKWPLNPIANRKKTHVCWFLFKLSITLFTTRFLKLLRSFFFHGVSFVLGDDVTRPVALERRNDTRERLVGLLLSRNLPVVPLWFVSAYQLPFEPAALSRVSRVSCRGCSILTCWQSKRNAFQMQARLVAHRHCRRLPGLCAAWVVKRNWPLTRYRNWRRTRPSSLSYQLFMRDTREFCFYVH